ncbi:MAG: ATP-dependent Clp protease proteolytic subunit [Gemmatimonadetes bacterium]|nr:ATP-dependent Clp protease proteolytic subunit [Gemmatimonadota bacterium]
MQDEETPEKPPQNNLPSIVTDMVKDRLFKARTLVIAGEVNQQLAAHIMAQLLAMSADSDAPITIYINSQGGHVESGDTIHDMIRYIKPRVKMVGTGWVASAGALIYVAVPREDRFALPNTRFLLHQPAGGAGGSAADIAIEAREILKMRERINRIFARQTGRTVEQIEDDTRRNFWLDAAAAVEYGLVGKIVESADEIEAA